MTTQADEARELLHRAFRGLSAGRHEEVIALADQILEIDEGHGDAIALHGHVALARGRLDDAERAYRRALTLWPREATYHYYLGEALAARGHIADALACHERALKINAGHAGALASKADILLARGRFDRAHALLAPLVRSGPAPRRLAVTFARIERRRGRPGEAVRFAEAQLDRKDAQGAFRSALLFELGAAQETLAHYDEAFAAFTEANALVQRPFDIDDVRARFDEQRRVFDPGRFATLPRSTVEDETPLLIVGLPRSGATLVEQIIHAHPKGVAAAERVSLAALAAELAPRAGGVAEKSAWIEAATPAQLDEAAQRYLGAIRRGQSGTHRIADRQLDASAHLGFVARLLPAARIVYTSRAPLDLCLSCWASNLAGTYAWSADFARIGSYHGAFVELMDFWQRHDGLRLLEVPYERLVAEPEPTIRALLEFAGLEWNDRCLRFHEAKRDAPSLNLIEARQPLHDRSVGRAERYGERLAPLRRALGMQKK